MSEEGAFLAAIASDPGDDTRRLAFADWTEERGGPMWSAYATFIRSECEAARLPVGDPRRQDLTASAAALRGKYEAEWIAPLAELGVESVHFERGLPDQISLPMVSFLANGAAILERYPTVRGIKVSSVTAPKQVVEFATLPCLAHLRDLDVSGCYIAELGANAIAQSRNLSDLCSLNLSKCLVNIGRGIVHIASSPYLSNLERLDVSCCGIDEEGIAAIARSSNFRNLRDLDLSENPIIDAAAEAIAQSDNLGHLQSLKMAMTDITTAGATAIAQSPRLGELRHFVGVSAPEESYTAVGDRSAQEEGQKIRELMARRNQGGGPNRR